MSAVEHHCDEGNHKVKKDVHCTTDGCEHKGKTWDKDNHQDWDHDYSCGDHTSASPNTPADRGNDPNRKPEI